MRVFLEYMDFFTRRNTEIASTIIVVERNDGSGEVIGQGYDERLFPNLASRAS